jgi:hypothetical protein
MGTQSIYNDTVAQEANPTQRENKPRLQSQSPPLHTHTHTHKRSTCLIVCVTLPNVLHVLSQLIRLEHHGILHVVGA